MIYGFPSNRQAVLPQSLYGLLISHITPGYALQDFHSKIQIVQISDNVVELDLNILPKKNTHNS